MGQNTSIEWCAHTLNLWWGCVEVSALCDNCYAREWAKRFDRAKWGAHEPRVAMPGAWKNLEKWQRDAAASGRIDSVFCGSMMDIFEKSMALVEGGMLTARTTGDLRETLFNGIGQYPNLLLLFLTKRPQNIPAMIPASWDIVPPPNVMFGTSVGTRDGLGAIDALRRAPGRRFLSMEPLLEDVGPLNLEGIDWVIVGSESGRGKRPMDVEWARSIKDQCEMAGVSFFMKQMVVNGKVTGEVSDFPSDLRVREMPAAKGKVTA